jgi:hypothetical protein
MQPDELSMCLIHIKEKLSLATGKCSQQTGRIGVRTRTPEKAFGIGRVFDNSNQKHGSKSGSYHAKGGESKMTPAQFTKKLCSDLLILDGSSRWKGYVGFLPAEPAEAIVFYDFGNRSEGRDMITGKNYLYPLIQIRVRSLSYEQAYAKCQEIISKLTEIRPSDNRYVSVGAETIHFQNFSFRSGPIHLGREEKSNREAFSINGQVTFRSV